MLRCLSLALVLATSLAAFIEPPRECNQPDYLLPQCRGRAWVRAPDLVAGDVIAGDVKVKLIGPCTDAESYKLGLRFKERVFWRLRRQDVRFPESPLVTYNNTGSSMYTFNETEWEAYELSMQNKTLWSVHEEERIAFEIKTDLVSAEGTDQLTTNFTSRFGILVPNTNYPPGVDYRLGAWAMASTWDIDTFYSEFIYEYFVEIKFRNGTTSEIPAGMTSFVPFHLRTENDVHHESVSLKRSYPNPNWESDMLESNYTIDLHFPDGAHVYQNSSTNVGVTVHRTGYVNRTDTPVEICVFPSEDVIEWHPQELKTQFQTPRDNIRALVPPMQLVYPSRRSSCREINFTAAATDLTQDSHVSSTSLGPLSLSLYADLSTVPDFSTYYQKFGHQVTFRLLVEPDPSVQWENQFEEQQWEWEAEHCEWEAKYWEWEAEYWENVDMDETDFDWVPWSPSIPMTRTQRPRPRSFIGKVNLSVLPKQKQGPVRLPPVHYLSDEARQPLFVDVSDINDLRLMSPDERNLIAPLAQPFIKVFAEGEELGSRYFTAFDGQKPIYVGETWANKVLPVLAEGHGTDTLDHLFVLQ